MKQLVLVSIIFLFVRAAQETASGCFEVSQGGTIKGTYSSDGTMFMVDHESEVRTKLLTHCPKSYINLGCFLFFTVRASLPFAVCTLYSNPVNGFLDGLIYLTTCTASIGVNLMSICNVGREHLVLSSSLTKKIDKVWNFQSPRPTFYLRM